MYVQPRITIEILNLVRINFSPVPISCLIEFNLPDVNEFIWTNKLRLCIVSIVLTWSEKFILCMFWCTSLSSYICLSIWVGYMNLNPPLCSMQGYITSNIQINKSLFITFMWKSMLTYLRSSLHFYTYIAPMHYLVVSVHS